NFASAASQIFARRWDGTAFREERPGEATRQGISDTGIGAQALAVAVDAAGQTFVAWNGLASGSPQIEVRGNQTALWTVYYVNGASNAGNNFTTAPGSAANNGLSPATPKASV